MGSERHRWGTQKQVVIIIICSIILTIFYSYLDLGAGREIYRIEGPFSYSHHLTKNFSYYLVDGAHCKIPNLDPHDWSVRQFIQKYSYYSCRDSLPHLVRLRHTPNTTEVHLEIDKRAGKKYYRGQVTCCYQRVTRVDGSDDGIRKEKEVCFKSSTALANSTQMVVVTCAKDVKTDKLPRKGNILYENMFYIIVLTDSVKARMKRQEDHLEKELNKEYRQEEYLNKEYRQEEYLNKKDRQKEDLNKEDRQEEDINKEDRQKEDLNKEDRQEEDLNEKDRQKEDLNEKDRQKEDLNKEDRQEEDLNKEDRQKEDLNKKYRQEEDLSLLIIGIDSISRLNMIRAMPRTREFLEQRGWFELEGYNKVGENTLPNLLPLLSGRSSEETAALCNPGEKGFFDPCPIIWKDLVAKGYITSYAEDSADINTFNYARRGFKEQPTDYYWRPLLKAGEGMFKQKTMDSIGKYCVGSSMEAELLMDYTHQFVNVFHKYSYFNLVWMNAFSHNDVNGPSRMDEKIFQFLSGLNYTALRNTAVIFLSDHGIRFGPVRTTYSGWFEERLPFIFFHLPDWYQEKYPEKIANLRANKNRLTCPYDVYETLNELTGLSNRSACEKCSSLLRPIDLDRACSDIRISEHFCTCTEMINLPQTDSRASDLGRVIVKHIDSLLSSHRDGVKLDFRCANLTLAKVHSLQTNRNPIKTDNTSSEMFIVQIETEPSKALFEATVVLQADEFHVTGDVSRLNMYRDQGACLKDNAIRLFCFCEPVENTENAH